MDVFIRTIAIIIEVLILAVIYYAVAKGAKIVIFNFGVKEKYNGVINIALIFAGIIFVVFCVAHLTTFYPPV